VTSTIRLKEFRDQSRLSQRQVAMRVKVHRSYITKIEQGHRLPGRDVLFRLADLFGCHAEDLLKTDLKVSKKG